MIREMSTVELNQAGEPPCYDGSNEADADEIERPRLEDSRASLLHLPHDQPSDLIMMLPQCRAQDLLLSSTMMQESCSLLDQDWPTASSIQLVNSRDSVGLSERLNNADICLEMSVSASASASVSAAAIAAPAPAPAPAIAPTASAESSLAASSPASVGGGDATSDASIASISASDSAAPESSPRLRVLSSSGGSAGSYSTGLQHHRQDDNNLQLPMQNRPDDEQHQGQSGQHQHQQQYVLGLLQVCRLTLDVLSEGGLLCDDARRWLTPELLCDKLCDRLYSPQQLPTTATIVGAAAGGAPSADSSVVMEFESPVGRVRQWLLAAGGGGGLSGSPLRRHVTNSV